MRHLNKIVIIFCAFIVSGCIVQGQDSLNIYNKIVHFPDRLFNKVNDKATDMNAKLTRQSEKYLQQLSKTEQKLKAKVAIKDSLAASRIFDDVQKQYADLQTKLTNVTGKATTLKNKYIPHLDSLKTAFSFLSKTDGLTKNLPETQSKLQGAMDKMDGLQDKFNQAEEIKKFIQQRQQLLKEQLGQFGLLKNLKTYQKQVYYYQAQVDEYKKLFDDPSKLETRALELLKNTQAFKDFFSKNSQLAGMFRLPSTSSSGSVASLTGLQTRESVAQDMMQRFGSIPDVQQVMHQQVQGAKDQLNLLKDKVNKLGGGSTEKEMPDFKPNDQKTKSLLQRLEFGSNLQTVKSNKFFPSTTDVGLSLGYKLNDKSTIGLGGSYKMGWGRDIRHISISHQGIGLRSFVDYKIKGSIWLSGGAEMNYRSQFSNFKILDNYSAWQKSALIGLSKKYQVSKKVKGNAQLMYDALWKEQVPRTQALVFRIGYNF
jgi:archaellum component FlaC